MNSERGVHIAAQNKQNFFVKARKLTLPLCAFTLIEVSLALGLAAFALVAVLGVLPTGLQVVREAQSQEIAANIARRLQANLQSVSFQPDISGGSIDTLGATAHYYGENGVETVDPANANSSLPQAFFKAVFTVGNVSFDDGMSVPGGQVVIQPSNGRNVTVTLCYPQAGQVPGNRKFVYSFLIARQGAQ